MATLQELRRSVGKRLGDLIVVEATSGGSDVIFADDVHLLGPDNVYRGRYLYLVGGTAGNIGEQRRVTSSTQSGGVLNISPALPDDVAEGDEAELWSTHAQGWTAPEVNDAIIEVNRDGYRNFFVPVIADVDDTFDAIDGFVELPDEITVGVYDLEFQTNQGSWISVDRATNRGGAGYWTTRGLGKLIIGGDYYLSVMNGMNLRVLGYGDGEPLEDDDDETSINPEWIVWESIYRLCFAAMERNPERARTLLPVAMQEAKMARERARYRPAPDWMRV